MDSGKAERLNRHSFLAFGLLILSLLPPAQLFEAAGLIGVRSVVVVDHIDEFAPKIGGTR